MKVLVLTLKKKKLRTDILLLHVRSSLFKRPILIGTKRQLNKIYKDLKIKW